MNSWREVQAVIAKMVEVQPFEGADEFIPKYFERTSRDGVFTYRAAFIGKVNDTDCLITRISVLDRVKEPATVNYYCQDPAQAGLLEAETHPELEPA